MQFHDLEWTTENERGELMAAGLAIVELIGGRGYTVAGEDDRYLFRGGKAWGIVGEAYAVAGAADSTGQLVEATITIPLTMAAHAALPAYLATQGVSRAAQ